jgi:hypothetical protein
MRLIAVMIYGAFGVLVLAQVPSSQPGKLAGGTPQAPGALEKTKPFVQVSSVSVDPKVIHRAGAPATITVQVASSGLEQIERPEIKVHVGTDTADPPDPKVNVEYLDSPQTQRIKVTSPAVFTFKVRAAKDALPGDITVKADVIGATVGIDIRDSNPPGDGLAKLKIE